MRSWTSCIPADCPEISPIAGIGTEVVRSIDASLDRTPGKCYAFSPTAMGITGFTGLPSASHFSISPATCQGQAAIAVAAFAVYRRLPPLAPEIICASQFPYLQKTMNTTQADHPLNGWFDQAL